MRNKKRKKRRKRRGFWKQHLTRCRPQFTFLLSLGCSVLWSLSKAHTSQCCQRVSKQYIDSQIWVMSLSHWNLLLIKGDGRFICLYNNASLFYWNQDMCWNLMKALERCPLTLKRFGSGPEVIKKKAIPPPPSKINCECDCTVTLEDRYCGNRVTDKKQASLCLSTFRVWYTC